MTQQGDSLSDVFRRAIAGSGVPLIALARATGVQRMSIARFLRGDTSLRLDKAEKLAAYFGLELRPKRKGR
jgi:plasmid maintenance system antidote protein VapI